nr:PT domain-containing protein [Helicobacter pylori]
MQPSNHPTIQPSNHPTIQPSNHPTIQPSNQAIIQSSNQAIKQRYLVVITFTKTDLKIPYFLSFPFSLTRATFLKNLIR